MPFSRSLRLGIACSATLLSLVPAAPAATTTADLRVVTKAGTTLADQSQVTGDVSIQTDPGATCFGPPGGSGGSVSVPGPSALGIIKDAADSNPALRPLSVTDQFGFGLGICGIGGSTFSQGESAFWYLKVNHVGAQVGGDQVTIKSGDDILWYLSPGFPPPNELELQAPPAARSGQQFTVRVLSYSDTGQRKPVEGALVTGGETPTAADGSTSVRLTRSVVLQALHGNDIPSNPAIVCVSAADGACGIRGHRIVGSNRRDRIRGTKLPDLIRARAAADRINTRGGLSDVVNCGRGRDTAIIGSADVVRRCEKVIRKG